jgi:hypothetical protein
MVMHGVKFKKGGSPIFHQDLKTIVDDHQSAGGSGCRRRADGRGWNK